MMLLNGFTETAGTATTPAEGKLIWREKEGNP